MGTVQDSETVGLGIHRQGGIGGAVDQHGVHKRLSHPGRVGGLGHGGWFKGMLSHTAGGRGAGLTGRIIVGVFGQLVRYAGGGRPEPEAINPASHRVDTGDIGRVFCRHVDMGPPEVAGLVGR